MTDTQTLLAEIEKFLVKSGMAPSTFGHKTAGHGKLVDRLRSGRTVTIETASAVRAFIRAETERLDEEARRKAKPSRKVA